MNRRRLITRFVAIAAATAAAPSVHPAEAAPATVPKTHAHVEGDGCPPDEYTRGLEAGLAGAVERYFDVESVAYVTIATADGKFVARVTDDTTI